MEKRNISKFSSNPSRPPPVDQNWEVRLREILSQKFQVSERFFRTGVCSQVKQWASVMNRYVGVGAVPPHPLPLHPVCPRCPKTHGYIPLWDVNLLLPKCQLDLPPPENCQCSFFLCATAFFFSSVPFLPVPLLLLFVLMNCFVRWCLFLRDPITIVIHLEKRSKWLKSVGPPLHQNLWQRSHKLGIEFEEGQRWHPNTSKMPHLTFCGAWCWTQK